MMASAPRGGIERLPGAETVASTDAATINHLPGSDRRYASLDALRGLAAVLVILFHTGWQTHLTTTPFIRNCYTAVDLFFLLSGFVIAASYGTRVQTGAQLFAFAQRRVFRVVPLHWAVLAFLVTMEGAKALSQHHAGVGAGSQPSFSGATSVPSLIATVLFLQGTGFFPENGWNPPSWSVSAELVAYGAFALTGYCGLLRRSWFIATVAVLGLAAYAVLAATHDTLDLTANLGIVRCLAGFPIGVALYRLVTSGRLAGLERLPVATVSLLEALAVLATGGVLALAPGGAVVLVIPCYIILLVLFQAERGRVSRALRARPLQWLGAISYSVYLVHIPIRTLLIGVAPRLGLPVHHNDAGRTILDIGPLVGDGLLLVFVALVLCVAALTFRFIEEPARLFGRRISSRERPARRPAAMPAGPARVTPPGSGRAGRP